jgi:hypothetical protein
MALAKVTFEGNQPTEPKERRLGAPKTASMDAWFKQARKTIPEIPNPKQTDWQIYSQDADINWVKFSMHNSVGEKCHIVIDRRVPFIG